MIVVDTNNTMSTQTEPTVEQAKALLRQARLRGHKANIRKALDANRDIDLATACSGFAALFRNRGNKGKK